MLNFTEIKTQDDVRTILNYCKKSGIFTLRKKMHRTYSKNIGDKIGYMHGGYLAFQYNRKVYRLHRLAFLHVEGIIPDVIDHINQVKTDNRWDNIIKSTHSLNSRNKPIQKNSPTKTLGVNKSKNGNFRALIYILNKRISLGTFKTELEAIEARKHAEKIYKFNTNHGKDE